MKKVNRSPRKVLAISPKVHEQLVKLAKRNDRTITAQVELLIKAEVLY